MDETNANEIDDLANLLMASHHAGYYEAAETILAMKAKADAVDAMAYARDTLETEYLSAVSDASILRFGLESVHVALKCVIAARGDSFDFSEHFMLNQAVEIGDAALNGQAWGSNDLPRTQTAPVD